MEIASLLASLDDVSENQQLDFKEAAVGLPSDLWETYSAFANTEGGNIVLGVGEGNKGFSAFGVSDAQHLVADFWATLRNPQLVERDVMLYDGVRIDSYDDMDFVVINVPRAERGDKPVRVYDKRTKQFVAWVRRGEGDFRASDADIRLMQYDGVPGADRKPIESCGLEVLNSETVHRYRNVFASVKPQSPWLGESDEDFLYHIGGIAKGHDGSMHPTQAGLLAFGHEYEITNYFPHYLLDYREQTSGEHRWDDRIVSQSGEWSGNLIDFYYRVTERLIRYFAAPFSTDKTGTVHSSRYSAMEAINEAVANALIHAYYGASGSVRIVLENDALNVVNPGSLLMDRSVAIAGGFSEARNPTLMRIFSFVGVSDRAGSGLQHIWSTWSKEYGLAPMLEEGHSPACVSLCLPLVMNTGGSKRDTQEELPASLSDAELIAFVEDMTSGTIPRDIHNATGMSIRSAQERLKKLCDEGALKRVRDGRFYRYYVE